MRNGQALMDREAELQSKRRVIQRERYPVRATLSAGDDADMSGTVDVTG